MDSFISPVLFDGSPLQIGEIVVRRIAIWKVSAFHVFWTGANERLQDETVNQAHMALSVSVQSNLQVTAWFNRVWFEHMPMVTQAALAAVSPTKVDPFQTRLDDAGVRNSVGRESLDGKKTDAMMFRRHGRPLSRLVVQSAASLIAMPLLKL